jgi:IS30 family transposase
VYQKASWLVPADVAASAFAGALNAIPETLRKTLTYDQGKEMGGHAGD